MPACGPISGTGMPGTWHEARVAMDAVHRFSSLGGRLIGDRVCRDSDSKSESYRDEAPGRQSSQPWAGRSTDIRIECSAVYNLRCIFMALIRAETINPASYRMDSAILPAARTITPLQRNA